MEGLGPECVWQETKFLEPAPEQLRLIPTGTVALVQLYGFEYRGKDGDITADGVLVAFLEGATFPC